MNIAFVMDPLEMVNTEKDTSFQIMLGAQKRGHSVFFVPKGGLCLKQAQLFLKATQVCAKRDEQQPFEELASSCWVDAKEFSAIMVRTDPPFDEAYLADTWFLDHAPKSCFVLNSPHGLRTVNEKIWVSQFGDWTAKTYIGADISEALDFAKTFAKVVLKPYDAFGGQGVFVFSSDDSNLKVSLELLTEGGSKPIVLQNYIEEAQQGDQRVLLLGGDILGTVLRKHSADDHRNNFFAGGSALACTVTDRQKQIVAGIKAHLLKLGLHFVGLDFLGDTLIEVNVTSPTCLQEMNRSYNVSLEDHVIDYMEREINHGYCQKS